MPERILEYSVLDFANHDAAVDVAAKIMDFVGTPKGSRFSLDPDRASRVDLRRPAVCQRRSASCGGSHGFDAKSFGTHRFRSVARGSLADMRRRY